MSQTSRTAWSYISWALALLLGAAGMYGANQKQVSDAHRDAQLASAQHALAAKAREEAAAKDRETRAFIDEFDYPIAMLNQRGEVVEWNAAAQKTFGWTKEDLQRDGLDILIPEDMRPRHHEAFGAAMRGVGTISGNVSVQRVRCVAIHKDKSRKPIPVEVSVRIVREDDGDLYALAHIDRQSRIVNVEAQEEKP